MTLDDEAMPPCILPGDLVLARRQHAVEDGEIAVVAWPEHETATLRRGHHFDRHLVLAADNPRFRPAAFPAVRKEWLTPWKTRKMKKSNQKSRPQGAAERSLPHGWFQIAKATEPPCPSKTSEVTHA